jgi:hypothetical protein
MAHLVRLVVLTRAALAVGWLAAALACSAAPRAPADVAFAYFQFLGRDPIRTLPLLTPSFHAQHGLHVVSAAEARAPRGLGERPSDVAESGGDWSLERRQLGWLEVQSREGFRALRDRFQLTLVDAFESGERAFVTLRVQPGRGAAFEQRFTLARDAAWRIDAIEQSGIVADNAFAAFVAHPTEAERQRLERLRASGP